MFLSVSIEYYPFGLGGGNFPLATKPTNQYLNRTNPDTGLVERSGFGREYDYLISKGYKYVYFTSSMVRQ